MRALTTHRLTTVGLLVAFGITGVLLAMGCDDSNGDPTIILPEDVDTSIPGDVAVSSNYLGCEKAFECRDRFEVDVFEYNYGKSPAECRSILYQNPDLIDEAVEEGRSIYFEENASSCLDQLQEMTCAQFAEQEWPQDCLSLFEGTLESGRSCLVSVECISHVYTYRDGIRVCR